MRIVLEIGGRWPHSCCFVGSCFQDLYDIARSILVQLPSSFFSIRFVSVHVVYSCSYIDTTAAWKKLCFVLSDRSDFHMIYNLTIALHGFAWHILMSFSVDEIHDFDHYFQRTTIHSRDVSFFFIKTRVLHFVYIHIETNAISCLLQTMQQRFG